MDINYLLRREQVSLAHAGSSPSRSARAVHRAFAVAYGERLAETSYPHHPFLPDGDRAAADGQCQPGEEGPGRWENEGGTPAGG